MKSRGGAETTVFEGEAGGVAVCVCVKVSGGETTPTFKAPGTSQRRKMELYTLNKDKIPSSLCPLLAPGLPSSSSSFVLTVRRIPTPDRAWPPWCDMNSPRVHRGRCDG